MQDLPSVPQNSKWTIVKFAYRKGGRNYWYCRCSCQSPDVPLFAVREDNLRSGRSSACRVCQNNKMRGWSPASRSEINGRQTQATGPAKPCTPQVADTAAVTPVHTVATETTQKPILMLEKGTSKHKFSKLFLDSLENTSVKDLQASFKPDSKQEPKQPPEVEKVLGPDLSIDTGRAPKDETGSRAKNLVLVGGSTEVSHVSTKQDAKEDAALNGRRVVPKGTDPIMFENGTDQTPTTIKLKFASNRKHKHKVLKMHCPNHGVQPVTKKHQHKVFTLACGCKRQKNLESEDQ